VEISSHANQYTGGHDNVQQIKSNIMGQDGIKSD
jgi:hypothetical protein